MKPYQRNLMAAVVIIAVAIGGEALGASRKAILTFQCPPRTGPFWCYTASGTVSTQFRESVICYSVCSTATLNRSRSTGH